ncbi:NAD(+) synthase [Oscillibacter hominis]|uniref:Glutamine-dependent NAD(+) synthetase n=1 Tax=Oscillibacter hominis TaxID=2763056 RepID=A0A7G9B3N5_9FIRM|nr:NAD(+) synthase [Oscillibacter hominis]QNL44166.1 NAD(+) synthase [Oscillibacter hominis]
MKDGFISVACGTPKLRLTDCDYNAEQSFTLMRTAAKAGVKVLVLPELGLTGYTCGDLFNQSALLEGAREALATILTATRNLEVVTAVGLPLQKNNKLYNCAAIIQKGSILGVVPKTHIPNYGEFYEKRHFAPAPEEDSLLPELCGQRDVPFGTHLLFRCETVPDLTLGFEVCEDLWAPCSPSVGLCQAGATIIGNLSASDEQASKDSYRRQLVAAQSAKLICGYIYASAGEGESSSDLVFSGHDIVAENGTILNEGRFETGLKISEVDVQRLAAERRRTQMLDSAPHGRYSTIPFTLTLEKTKLSRYVAPQPFVPESREDRDERCQEILLIAALGLKQRLEHTAAKTAVVGLSGGLDSTLAMLITMIAMKMLDRPTSDVVAVTMPCFGTTKRTRTNAQVLAEQLGATLQTVDISDTVRSHFRDIGHDMADHSVTFENAQARERTQVLMDIANKTGGIVIGTGDLSELALGWATYNGDHMSMYGVNASIPKTLVRHLVAYVAKDNSDKDEALADVLEDILATPVSPELLPAIEGKIAQKTEDLVGPYELHDFFLYYIVRWGFPPRKVYRLAQYALGKTYDRETILKWLNNFYRRFFAQQFKRNCLPDGPKVGSVAFSPRGDWRMPSDAKWTLWEAELKTLE